MVENEDKVLKHVQRIYKKRTKSGVKSGKQLPWPEAAGLYGSLGGVLLQGREWKGDQNRNTLAVGADSVSGTDGRTAEGTGADDKRICGKGHAWKSGNIYIV